MRRARRDQLTVLLVETTSRPYADIVHQVELRVELKQSVSGRHEHTTALTTHRRQLQVESATQAGERRRSLVEDVVVVVGGRRRRAQSEDQDVARQRQ